MTTRVIVFHRPEINNGQTVLTGTNISVEFPEDRSLMILDWETDTEKGNATFAHGAWYFVCASDPK